MPIQKVTLNMLADEVVDAINSATAEPVTKYLYALSVDNNSNLVFSKIDFENDDSTTFPFHNPENRGSIEAQAEFPGLGTNYIYNNIDEDHTLIDPTVARTQFKVRYDNMYYFLNDDGNLVLRVGTPYSYS